MDLLFLAVTTTENALKWAREKLSHSHRHARITQIYTNRGSMEPLGHVTRTKLCYSLWLLYPHKPELQFGFGLHVIMYYEVELSLKLLKGTHQNPRAYAEKMTRNVANITRPLMSAFLLPNLRASFSSTLYLQQTHHVEPCSSFSYQGNW